MENTVSNTAENEFTDLHMQSHIDLSERARGGIVIYLVVWLITAIWGDIPSSHPAFFYLNTLVFSVTAVLRIAHYLILKNRPNSNTRRMYRLLITLIFVSACHWGMLASWIMFGSQSEILYYPYMTITTAFAIGGAAILSISRSICRFYTLVIFTPTLLVGIMVAGTENLILVLLAGFSILYVLASSRVSHNDYWKGITNHKEANTKAKLMEHLSITDPLTNLRNRMYFNQRFSEEWDRCEQLRQPLSVLMIDLDHFKSVNDTYGHMAGDECLKAVAQTLSAAVQDSIGTVARYGGEEFIVLLPDTDLATTKIIAERIVHSIGKIKLIWNEQRIPVSCSIGCSMIFPDIEKDGQALIIAADEALYEAKEKGRNQYCIAA